jgi:hypothetical protein
MSVFHGRYPAKQIHPAMKPFWAPTKISGNEARLGCQADQARNSIMSTLITLIYREYCRARVAEIRRSVGPVEAETTGG